MSHLPRWVLSIEGEGAYPDSLPGSKSEQSAVKWAHKIIRGGDWDLAKGEIFQVKYTLRRGNVFNFGCVTLEG